MGNGGRCGTIIGPWGVPWYIDFLPRVLRESVPWYVVEIDGRPDLQHQLLEHRMVCGGAEPALPTSEMLHHISRLRLNSKLPSSLRLGGTKPLNYVAWTHLHPLAGVHGHRKLCKQHQVKMKVSPNIFSSLYHPTHSGGFNLPVADVHEFYIPHRVVLLDEWCP